MKTLILSLMTSATLLATEPFSADISEFEPPKASSSFTYWNIGATDGIPQLGLGFRNQFNTTGFDLNVSAGTLDFSEFMLVKSTAMALWYPKPNANSQLYVGFGPGLLSIFDDWMGHFDILTPNVCFGSEQTNTAGKKHFYQLQVELPYYVVNPFSSDSFTTQGSYPSVELKAGFNF